MKYGRTHTPTSKHTSFQEYQVPWTSNFAFQSLKTRCNYVGQTIYLGSTSFDHVRMYMCVCARPVWIWFLFLLFVFVFIMTNKNKNKNKYFVRFCFVNSRINYKVQSPWNNVFTTVNLLVTCINPFRPFLLLLLLSSYKSNGIFFLEKKNHK